MTDCTFQSIHNLPRDILDIHPVQGRYHGYYSHEEVTDRDGTVDLQTSVL